MPAGTGTRAAATARCLWGTTCLVVPARVAAAAGSAPGSRATWFARILGVRELAQGAATLVLPTRGVVSAGVVIDVLHAVSAVALGVADASRRRPALLNAVAATSWALLGLTLVRGDSAPPARPRRTR